jgi:hypothetical protein
MNTRKGSRNQFIQPKMGKWSRKRLKVIGASLVRVKKRKVNSPEVVARHKAVIAKRNARIKAIGAGNYSLDQIILDAFQRKKGKLTSRTELWRICKTKKVDGDILRIRIGVLAEANRLPGISFDAHMARYWGTHQLAWRESAKVTRANTAKKVEASKRKQKPADLTFGRNDVTHTTRTFGG